MTVCIQCALEAFVAGTPVGDVRSAATFDETPEEHMRSHHPDPVLTQIRRAHLYVECQERLREIEATMQDVENRSKH